MYLKVKDIVNKCTEKSEGLLVYEHCRCSMDSECIIKVDFDGVFNVTDDFVFAFLGSFQQDKAVINRIQYVRAQTYIVTKFKRATRQIAFRG